ncbi:hypothetical protein GCM10017786_54620 [Amycolatopsis deserti]|uniref:Uncharacterized protein n=1 Tax=Amycolatopsis deserti TaxID=185696 RepID=A0ABQ3JDN1_9PSEU|nr:hypothetical protein GCM10017786_54620 [Amycolatopsis deserti]
MTSATVTVTPRRKAHVRAGEDATSAVAGLRIHGAWAVDPVRPVAELLQQNIRNPLLDGLLTERRGRPDGDGAAGEQKRSRAGDERGADHSKLPGK